MPGKIAKRTITDLAEALKMKGKNNQSMVLFLGSRASSLFHGSSFYNVLKEYSRRNFALLSREEQFAECYKILSSRFDEREIDTILSTSLQGTVVTEASICLAELIKQGLFDTIISTNIDTFLEDALKEIGMKEVYDFEIFMPGRNSLQEIIYSDRKLATRLIKVFGDLPSRVYNLTKRDFFLDEETKNYLERILTRDVLILGFDPFWDREMLRVFNAQEKALWLISKEAVSANHPLVSKANSVNKIKCITGKVGGYEQFLKALYWHLSEEVPTNYQLVRDTHRELMLMHKNISLIEKIYDEVQAIHKKISLEHNGGDII